MKTYWEVRVTRWRWAGGHWDTEVHRFTQLYVARLAYAEMAASKGVSEVELVKVTEKSLAKRPKVKKC